MNKTRIGIALKKAREMNDLTQAAVVASGILSKSHISQIESGERGPGLSTFVALCGLYNVSVDDILELSRDENQFLEIESQWHPTDRQYFAAKAMQGQLANEEMMNDVLANAEHNETSMGAVLSRRSFEIADAMIAEAAK